MNEIQKTTTEFVKKLLAGRGPELTPTTSLVVSGLLDSVSVVEIVAMVEEKFGVSLAETGFDPLDFDTIEGITQVVESRLAAMQSG